MNIRAQIDQTFGGKAFQRPLFYTYPGGLRFELSEGGHYLNQFITALNKAIEVCSSAFVGAESITVYLKLFGGTNTLSILQKLRALKAVGLFPSTEKEYWADSDPDWNGDDEYINSRWHYIAYSLPMDYLINALWCALSSDIGSIQPRVQASVYLFDLPKRVMVWPYDDRGMDIVGPNRDLLNDLYKKFSHYLLDYDRDAMDAVFANMP